MKEYTPNEVDAAWHKLPLTTKRRIVAIVEAVMNERAPEPEKWLKECDTQHLPQVAPVSGIYICTTPFANEMGYGWKDDERLKVISYEPLYDVVRCCLPGQEQEFEMSVQTLLDHFTPVEMVG